MIKILGQFRDYNLPMFHSSLIILLLICVAFHVEAQSVDPNFPSDEPSDSKPSVLEVVSVLSIMFALTFTFLVYAKFCYRRAALQENDPMGTGLISRSSRFSGIDKTLIEALPLFRFSSLKGSKEGLECAVCLSKFEDTEVLRLLPKCKHAFHINCIDHWLEKHSSCPLCRHRVSSEDLAFITHSTSMRVMWNSQSEHRQDSNIELFVQREEDLRGSSRFSRGSSFRIPEKVVDKEEELLIQEAAEMTKDQDQKILHKHKHKIIVSDLEFKSRWSNVSPSDLVFLNSEMINTISSNRFPSTHLENEQFSTTKATGNEDIIKIREEMEMRRLFENKVSTMNINSSASSPTAPSTSDSIETSANALRSMNGVEKRSMSEMTALSRFGNMGFSNRTSDASLLENNVNEERMRRLWLPIARRTVQWFANREKRSQEQPLDV